MSNSYENLADLSPAEKRALLAEVLRKNVKGPKSFPLSFAQQRLWFLDQLEPGSPFYNMPGAVELTGRLDVAALEQTLREIVRRHASLRTTFALAGGRPSQVITPGVTFNLTLVDLSALLPEDRHSEARRLSTEEAQRPFDLARGPLLRATLLRLSEEKHIVLFTMHHVISDGWSMGVLVREVATLYEAFASGRPSPLPELAIQYADYAVWQRERLQGEFLEQQLAYWRAQLDGAPSVIELPTDHPRPAIQSFRGARRLFTFDEQLSTQLKQLSQREGVTLFMTLLAAFQTLLARYSGQGDVVVGSPIAGRTRAEVEPLIGFFVNTLVLRTDVGGGQTFSEVLRRVREVCLGAYAHQDVPFEKLVEELQPERSLTHTPLFQVMFVFQSATAQTLQLPGLELSELSVESDTSKFDLTLLINERVTDFSGAIEYSTDLRDASTIRRMIGHFEVLLRSVVMNPEQKITELPLLTGAERHHLLVERNDTAREYPSPHCVQEVFEQQAERTPESVAVVFDEQQLTYRELNRRANQLARYLRRLGVGPESRVGLLMERSPEMVLAVLGVLKSGAAYVPLDPAYPLERLSFMLSDSGACVLLTQGALRVALPPHPAQVVELDKDWKEIAEQSAENLKSGASAENLAYVIYTSGSTGRPKGVAMTHRALVNLIYWQLENLKWKTTKRALQFASLSFDVSFQEIFTTWCSGGTLLLISEDARRDAVQLISILKQQSIERVFLPFVALQNLAEAMDIDEPQPESLRDMVTAGEQLQITPSIAKLFRRWTRCRLHNHYGPSESHVVTTYTLDEFSNDWATLPPIGRPIANTEIHIVDGEMQPVPLGVSGELYIGGEALGRGYLDRPELTAERFVPHPFSLEPGARLYRTGDLARHLACGEIEYAGRIDHQVKVRGFRIELGEIESALTQHPGVRETVVVTRNDAPGEKRLAAYVVARTGQSLSSSDLRTHLRQQLPEYMIPSAFVMLESLPLTPSGKIDRRALPAPEVSRAELEGEYVGPRTAVEEMIAGIWSSVLKVEQVGINENFFEVGGHSLIATQVMSRVRDAFQVEMPLRSLFERPTVAGLAEVIEAEMRSEGKLETPAIRPVSREAALPLSFAQQRLWFIDQMEPASTAYNLGGAVRLHGRLDLAALGQTFSEIMRRHE
ncbi:MAG: amino acid adenylation domain-containing protein, partial [Pyrinomonadaceae bacterium]